MLYPRKDCSRRAHWKGQRNLLSRTLPDVKASTLTSVMLRSAIHVGNDENARLQASLNSSATIPGPASWGWATAFRNVTIYHWRLLSRFHVHCETRQIFGEMAACALATPLDYGYRATGVCVAGLPDPDAHPYPPDHLKCCGSNIGPACVHDPK